MQRIKECITKKFVTKIYDEKDLLDGPRNLQQISVKYSYVDLLIKKDILDGPRNLKQLNVRICV